MKSSDKWTPAGLAERICEIVRDDLLQVDGDFGTRSNLIEAGLDSLALTQLLLAIEESTGVWVDEGLLNEENLESCETLAACIHEHLAGAA